MKQTNYQLGSYQSSQFKLPYTVVSVSAKTKPAEIQLENWNKISMMHYVGYSSNATLPHTDRDTDTALRDTDTALRDTDTALIVTLTPH